MKRETLEEAIKSYCEKEYSTPKPLAICIDFAKLGAKWQSEKNEEMFRNFIRTHHLTRIWNEWVKQYKK